MPSSVAHDLLILLFIIQLMVLSVWWTQQRQPISFRTYRASGTGPCPLRPRTPDDCPECRAAATVSQTSVAAAAVPYPQLKSSRGPLREKTIPTPGYACPHPACRYFNSTDPTIHALVGYGHPGPLCPIQDFYCQACRHKFSARRHTALYHLRTPPARVAQAEGARGGRRVEPACRRPCLQSF